MKFKFQIKNSLKIAMVSLFLVILIGTGLIISRLVIYGSDAFSIVSLSFAIVVMFLLAMLLFNTNYSFKETTLNVCLGVMIQKIKYNDILMIKNYVKHNELFIIFRPNNPKTEEDFSQIMINVKPELFADFVDALKSKNNMIVYDEINADINEEN